jgi:hypothetical protein
VAKRRRRNRQGAGGAAGADAGATSGGRCARPARRTCGDARDRSGDGRDRRWWARSLDGDRRGAEYFLAGKVDIGAVNAGHQNVTIVWALKRAADGKEIGQVSQENAVPAGSLDGAWGDTAYDVAAAAAGGIVELLQRAQAAGS